MRLFYDQDKRGRKIVVIEDAKIMWTNFRGIADRYNAAGHRNFCIVLPQDAAEEMKREGWNVKYTRPKNDEYDPEPYISVNISWAFKAPSVVLLTSKGETELDEETVGILDTAEITRVDIALDMSYRKKDDGSTGIKGYVKSMEVELYEDPIKRRRAERMAKRANEMSYTQPDDEDEEIPFN